jgi:predicted nucleic acid-binding protein
MSLLRVYMDSSVLGGCRDVEYEADSLRLVHWAQRGEITLLFSEILLRELEAAPSDVQDILRAIPSDSLEFVPLTSEVLTLRDAYIAAGIVGPQWLNDAAHVAAATVAHADAIVSWDFKHVASLEKIRGYDEVNESLGYGSLIIVTPREVRSDEREI